MTDAIKIITECIEKKIYNTANVIFDSNILSKNLNRFTKEQIIYALRYYKSKGIEVPSMQWLMGNMEIPCSLLNAEEKMKNQKGDAHERNWQRLNYKSKAEHRESYPEHLFTETG